MKTLLACTAILLLACPIFAAQNDSAKTVNLSAQELPLDQAITEIGRQSGARIILDTDVSGKVNASLNNLALDQALDVIAASNGLKWQKVYVAEEPDGKSTLEQIKAQLSLLATLSKLSIAAYDPESKEQIIVLRQPVTKDTPPPLSPEMLGLTPFYFVSLPKAPAPETPKETASTTKDYATLQAERMKAFQNMTSDQRQTAFREEIEQEMNLPEDVRRDMVRDRVSAIRNMDQGLLHDYMRAWGEAFRDMRGGGPPGGGPPGGGPP